MNNNVTELRTLARDKGDPESNKPFAGTGIDPTEILSRPRQRQRLKSLTESSSYNLNTKKGRKLEKDMYNTKKTEKKAGIREWFFGRTAKTNKPKTANLPKPEVLPIVERLQKQSAYLRATLKNDDIAKRSVSPSKARNDQDYSNFDEFMHKKHCLQIHARPTWCDVCEDFIWGIYRSAVRCKYCRYTCHYRCHLDINLNCPKAPIKERSLEDLTKETLNILNEATGKTSIEDEAVPVVNLPASISSIDELRQLIQKYNESSSLIMTLQDDGVFHGFVRVLMNLNRPVNMHSDTSDLSMKRALRRSNSKRVSKRHQSVAVSGNRGPAGNRGPSLRDRSVNIQNSTMPARGALSADDDGHSPNHSPPMHGKRPRRRMSFYLPQNTKKPLHITSSTTASEVIEALLDKYGVTDNPQKFALYERTEENDHIRLRKMDIEEHPLVLSLLWEEHREDKSFSLQENERGEILWDAFEMPELQNFLVFLKREEEEMISQVRKKYEDQKRVLQEAMDQNRIEEPSDSEC